MKRLSVSTLILALVLMVACFTGCGGNDKDKTDLSNLTSKVAELQDENSNLKNEISKQKEEITSLNGRISTLESANTSSTASSKAEETSTQEETSSKEESSAAPEEKIEARLELNHIYADGKSETEDLTKYLSKDSKTEEIVSIKDFKEIKNNAYGRTMIYGDFEFKLSGINSESNVVVEFQSTKVDLNTLNPNKDGDGYKWKALLYDENDAGGEYTFTIKIKEPEKEEKVLFYKVSIKKS